MWPACAAPQVEFIDLREAQRRAREAPEPRPLTVADIMHRHSQQDFGWWRLVVQPASSLPCSRVCVHKLFPHPTCHSPWAPGGWVEGLGHTQVAHSLAAEPLPTPPLARRQ